MKKLFLVIFLVLAGCSSAPQNKTDNQTAETEEKTESVEPKGGFNFSLDEFIDEYNNQIDNGKEKIPSHLQKDEKFFKLDGGSYAHILAKEADNDTEHKGYILSSIHNKNKELTGINFRISTAVNKDKVLNFSSTGTLAGYKLM